MTKNSIINALSGLLYIVLVVSLVYYSPKTIDQVGSIFLPIMMLSLFVFSAACMGYLLLYQPLQLFLEGEKKSSVDLFIKTLIAFAISAAVLVLIGLYLTASL
jgi:branched-subunit amino acid permease